MATIVQGTASVNSGSATEFNPPTLGATPTSGNLLVLYYGARDDDDSATPTFTMPSGFTKVAETSPMEFHAVGIAFKTSDGTETVANGDFTVTAGASVDSYYIGVVEFNEAGVSSWALDQASNDGSGATSVSSIASGSTGTLGSSTGVAAIAGTSRTGAEGLSTDTGTSLDATDTDFQADAGRANYIGAWLSLTATTALDATISESGGASRMGAAIATFIEEASGITGSAAISEPVDTVSASGTVLISGSAAVTEPVDSAAASGSVLISGSAAITEPVDTISASGSTAITGSAAITEPVDVIAATGAVLIAGSAAVVEPADTVTATGAVLVSGTAGIVEPVDVVSASGTVAGADIVGSASILEPVDTVTASGSVLISGTAGITEPADLVTATGGVLVSGTAAITEPVDLVSASFVELVVHLEGDTFAFFGDHGASSADFGDRGFATATLEASESEVS